MSKDTITPLQGATPPTNRAVRRRAQALGTGKDVATTSGPSKWQLRRESSTLLPGWSVNECMHKVVDGFGAVSGIYVPSTKTAVLSGVKRCRSVWVCPICASQITERRRVELRDALALWRDAEQFNGRVVMCTYTFRHDVAMPLKWMIARVNEAFRAMKKSGSYGRFLKRYGVRGTVAAREVKHSQVNGWHPHIHELLFLAGDADVQLLERELRVMWETAAAAVGLSMNQHGFKLDDCDGRVADYIAKFGHDPAWTEAEEVSKWHLKRRGSAVRQADEHYTPFQLLRFSLEGDAAAGKLFVEYAEAFYGRAQLRWKSGFREFLGLQKEMTDDECIEVHEELGEVMVSLDAGTEWPIITGNDAVGEFVAALATGDMQVVCDFLAAFGIERDPGRPVIVIDLAERRRHKQHAGISPSSYSA